MRSEDPARRSASRRPAEGGADPSRRPAEGGADPSRRRADGPTAAPPDAAAAEALARARHHALRALGEALEAGRALVDAASLAATGAPASEHPLFASADAWIAGTSRRLASGGGLGAELGPALACALDAEIGRWEQRAAHEEEARAVLRAFLGLREILWEVGVRPAPSRGPAPAARRPRRPVERVAVVQSQQG